MPKRKYPKRRAPDARAGLYYKAATQPCPAFLAKPGARTTRSLSGIEIPLRLASDKVRACIPAWLRYSA
ncbi:MAG: hypothetical protein WBQ78_01275, partial [Gammaproteobacteria bacterium]